MTTLFLFPVFLFTLQGLLFLSHDYHSDFLRKKFIEWGGIFLVVKAQNWEQNFPMSYVQEIWPTKVIFTWVEISSGPLNIHNTPEALHSILLLLLEHGIFQLCRAPTTLTVTENVVYVLLTLFAFPTILYAFIFKYKYSWLIWDVSPFVIVFWNSNCCQDDSIRRVGKKTGSCIYIETDILSYLLLLYFFELGEICSLLAQLSEDWMVYRQS